MKKIAIIGGGASGMALSLLIGSGFSVTMYERSDRLGRKLSATGNGQGNLTNTNIAATDYFSDDLDKAMKIIRDFDSKRLVSFLESLGGLYLPDDRGRVYPAGKQASAVTDLLRLEIARRENLHVYLNEFVTKICMRGTAFEVTTGDKQELYDIVVLSVGGKASPKFGTDGNGYSLAKSFGHTVTPLRPALVRLNTDSRLVKGLKGIRVEANLTLCRKQKQIFSTRGDVLFTENGVSGDAVFKTSSYAVEGDMLYIDFLPDVDRERILAALGEGENPLLCIVQNGLARAILRQTDGNAQKAVDLLKAYPLPVTGTAGFDGAQVTKGGIPLKETDEHLMSRFQDDLYFTGEILNVDGVCGGYNLQWAFSSAYAVARAISESKSC